MSPTWDDEYLTVKEIAAHLKLNEQTLRNWIFSTVVGVCPATAMLRQR
jgi:hypothetical protein